jgi:hypothetical protein
MTDRKAEAINEIVKRLSKAEKPEYKVLLGFDACIDIILRAVRRKEENRETEYFTNIRQYGEYLIQHENMSCGIELETRVSKTGGNMVITGNALGNLGIRTDCIGTFGFPDILPVFRSMSPNCTLHTIGDTITASALEFNDSKIIMFDPGPYSTIDWEGIKNQLGIERIKQLFSGRQLAALLNWSEMEKSSLIWKGIYEEVFPSLKQEEIPAAVFADLSDCSRKSAEQIKSAISILANFRKCSRVILSLNRNEAGIIARALNIADNISDDEFIRKLYTACNVNEIVIHRTEDAIVFNGKMFEKCSTFFCREPKILTGGGDNFNAGYCFAGLYGFDLFQSLLLANAVSGYYVKTGISPDPGQLIDFLRNSRKLS